MVRAELAANSAIMSPAFAALRRSNMPKHHIPCATLASATILLFLALADFLDIASGPCRLAAAEPAHIVRLLLTWGKRGSLPGEFDFPIGIAITRGSEVLVTDHYNDRIQKFDSRGKLLSVFPVLPHPGGIALDAMGNIYLSHFPTSAQKKGVTPDRLTVYDHEGKLLRQWGKTGAAAGEFNYPGGMAIGRDGSVYVADQTNHRIQVFTLSGQFKFLWGKYGAKPGEFGGNGGIRSRASGPDFVALDREGNIYTTEAMGGRVQKFTRDGRFLSTFGSMEDRPGSFGRDFERVGKMHGPIGICCDRDDRLWITTAGGRVQQFTSAGRYLRGFGEKQGSEPGQFLAPHGVALDSRGDLYVVDSFNHRVQKFDVGHRD